MSNIRLRPVGRKHSFFNFIEDHCLQETEKISTNRAFHRLCSLMRKMNAKTAVIEDTEIIFPEIKLECDAINSYFDKKTNFKAYRFTFLSAEIKDLKDITRLSNENFLASVIIINFETDKKEWQSYLFKAIVVQPFLYFPELGPMPLLNNYLHIYKTFSCSVNISVSETHNFQISGSFFCQQNSFTSVCAHASLCMTINNMNLQTMLITTEEINKIIGVDHRTKKFGISGNMSFTINELRQVLKHYELSMTVMDFFENPNYPYNEFIYRYIEGKCPVLLTFTTNGPDLHIVPILGHTLNADMWKPEAETLYSRLGRLDYKSSAEWIDHFIIHDDNFGMYLCLPVDSLKKTTIPKLDPNFRAYYAIAILPANIKTPSYEAEFASVIIVKDSLNKIKEDGNPLDKWSDRIVLSEKIIPKTPIVVRTLLTTPDDYYKSLGKEDFDGNLFSEEDKKELVKGLPPYFWLSEITLTDLYTANKTKIIDFFYSATLDPVTESKQIYERWIQMRFPGALFRRSEQAVIVLSVTGHYPILTLETQSSPLQW